MGVFVDHRTRLTTGDVISHSALTSQLPTPVATRGRQITDDESHPEWRFGTPSGDSGGPFVSQKKWISLVNPKQFTGSRITTGSFDKHQYNYTGHILVSPIESIAFPSSNQRSLSEMIQAGSTAISRCKPTNVVADLATFLLELRNDGLPHLVGSSIWEKKIKSARSGGDEYLNVEFGWKPMISDILNVFQSITHANTVLSQYERGSGSLTRRRYYFPVEKTSTISIVGSSNPATYPDASPMLDSGLSPGTTYKLRTTYRQVWFSGAFTYHLPSDFNSRNRLVALGAKVRTLLGLDLTPEVLWNAAPWSWAVDWFSNVGDVLSNYSDWATDGLVMKYGYVMEHSSVRERYYCDGPGRFRTAFPKLDRPTPIDAWVETKQRVVSSPFGFGLDWSGMTPRQLSITAALGLSRSR
jgi:hypothetical protein